MTLDRLLQYPDKCGEVAAVFEDGKFADCSVENVVDQAARRFPLCPWHRRIVPARLSVFNLIGDCPLLDFGFPPLDFRPLWISPLDFPFGFPIVFPSPLVFLPLPRPRQWRVAGGIENSIIPISVFSFGRGSADQPLRLGTSFGRALLPSLFFATRVPSSFPPISYPGSSG